MLANQVLLLALWPAGEYRLQQSAYAEFVPPEYGLSPHPVKPVLKPGFVHPHAAQKDH